MPNSVCLLGEDDLPAIMRLKAAAGWNQTETDWRRLLDLSPDGCFGLRVDGELAATTTTLSYGKDLAWIGMVLTSPKFRRRGLARILMEHAMAFLERRGVRRVGLDATSMGRPLYEGLGFQTDCVVERWVRSAGILDAEAGALAAGWMPDLDRRVFGTDRGALLTHLAAESAVVRGDGFAMTRSGSEAAYFGPAVAESAEAAEQLLEWCLARYAGGSLYWDLLPANTTAVELAAAHGFRRARVLDRMFHGGRRMECDVPRVFAIAGLEYG